MGASASIEVSFVDQNTGEFLTHEKIAKLCNEVQKVVDSFDFTDEFYMNFKRENAYQELAKQWKISNSQA